MSGQFLIPIGYDQYVEARDLECVRPPLPDELENEFIHHGRPLKSVLVRADGRVHGSTYTPGVIAERANTVLQSLDGLIEIGFDWHISTSNLDVVRVPDGELPINESPDQVEAFKSVIIKHDGTVYGSCYVPGTIVKRAGGVLARDIVAMKRGQVVDLFDVADAQLDKA